MIELQVELLALEPHSNGLAFATFAEDGDLIDWGSFDARHDKSASVRRRARKLTRLICPIVVAIEDIDRRECKRSPRIRALLHAIRQDLLDAGFKLARVPRGALQQSANNWSDFGGEARLTRFENMLKVSEQVSARTHSKAVRKAIRIGIAAFANTPELTPSERRVGSHRSKRRSVKQ